MLTLFSRLFGSILIGLCLSTFVVLLMTLFLTMRNMPSILANLQRMFQWVLRSSYRLYNLVLSPVRVRFFQRTGFDLFHPISRVICTVMLSLAIGTGLLTLFSQPILEWELIALAVHGGFVGLAWDGILRSDDFQMGVNLE